MSKKITRESEKFLKFVFHSIPSGLFTVDLKRRITSWSLGAERLTGIKEKNAKGKKCTDIIQSATCFKKCRLYSKNVKKPIYGKECEVEIKGKKFIISKNVDFLRDEKKHIIGGLETFEDITARKKAEGALRKTEERYRLQFEKALDAIFIADTETGIITDCNPAAEKLIGRKKSKLVGRHQRILHPKEEIVGGVSRTFKKHINEKDGRILETRVITKTGKIKDVTIKANMFEVQGKKMLMATFRDITERKKAEELIIETEKRHRLIFQTTPEAMYITDLKGNYIEANDRTAWMHRYKNLAEFLNLRKTFFDLIIPADRARARKDIQKCIKEGYLESVQYRTIGKHGETFFIEMSASVTGDSSGKPAEIIIVSRDITWRMELEYNLRERVKERHCLYNLSKLTCLTNIRLDEVLKKAVDLIPFAWQDSENICAQIIYKDRKFQTDNFRKTRREQSSNIIVNKKPVGAVKVFYLKEKSGIACLAKEEKTFLTAVAERLGEIIDRRIAADNLLASERKHRELFESSQDGIVLTDMQGYILDANRSFLHMLGYKMEEMRKMSFWQITPKKWHEFERKIVREQYIKKGYSDEYEKEYITKPGVVFPVSLRGWLVKDEKGRPAGMWKIVRDIGVRKKEQVTLLESEEKYRLIYETSGDSIMTLEPPAWRFTSGNPAIVKMFGVKNEKEFIALTPWQASPKYQPDGQLSEVKAAEMIGIAMKKGDNFFEWTHKKVTGEEFLATVLLNRIKSGPRIFLQARVRDITERQKSRMELKASERRYRDVTLSMNDWVWEVDALGKYIYCSEQVEKVMGYSVKEMLGKTPFNFMPPDETVRITRIFNSIAANKQPIKDLENWNIRKDGQKICMLTTGVPLLDRDGNLIGYRGVDKDITERKQAEDNTIRSLQEKEVLLQEIQHRVKNNLQVITSLMHMQSKKIAAPEIKNMFKEAMSRINTMSLIHSFLYKGGDVSQVNMKEFIEELVRSLIIQYSLGEMKLSHSVDIGDIWFSVDFSMPCGLIINELVTNSLKYAFVERETGNINISFAGSKDNEVVLTVSDDGVGMPEGFDISESKSLGYRLIKILSEVQLKGSFEVNSGKNGTAVTIKFNKGD